MARGAASKPTFGGMHKKRAPHKQRASCSYGTLARCSAENLGMLVAGDNIKHGRVSGACEAV